MADDIVSMLLESAERVFCETCTKDVVNAAEAGTWPVALWDTLEALGFTHAAVPEDKGGSGLALADALRLTRIAGRHAAPVPFGETIIAAWLLAAAGLEAPDGPLAFGPADRRKTFSLTRNGDGWVIDGSLRNIPWGAQVRRLALLAETDAGLVLASLDPALAQQTAGKNLAGEPRVRLDFKQATLAASDVAPAPADLDAESAYLLGALLRGKQMAGALQAARDLAVRYTGERIAFGKPLNKLQAVQQNLAVLAGQAAAAKVAADMALDALAAPNTDREASIGLAKVRINEAAEIGARLVHQAHGAIGFTYEHTLHHATRRLWSWRDEFGNEAYWSQRIGQRIVAGGPDQLWSFVTRAAQL